MIRYYNNCEYGCRCGNCMKQHIGLWDRASAEERRLLVNGLLTYDELEQRERANVANFLQQKAMHEAQQATSVRAGGIANPVGYYQLGPNEPVKFLVNGVPTKDAMQAAQYVEWRRKQPPIGVPVGNVYGPPPSLSKDARELVEMFDRKMRPPHVAPPPMAFPNDGYNYLRQAAAQGPMLDDEEFSEPIWWYCSDVHMMRHYAKSKAEFVQQADTCSAIRRQQEQREYDEKHPKEPPPVFTCDMCQATQEAGIKPLFLPEYPLVKLCGTCHAQMKPLPAPPAPLKAPIDNFRWWHGLVLLGGGLAVNYGADAWPLVDGVSAIVAAAGGIGLFFKWVDGHGSDGDIP